ncbi:helicase-related protein, partial [Halorubrum sp. Ea8]|uniref:helicase-related protein n=1 Tax=Halorubrum sp. Ea8 TaxID=1383841 RepID=UPI000BCA5206
GGLAQSQRREQVEKFRSEANIMLATDAAREGINLQFAHIMVNYDLPWNPIRIDQRMGRLHRYGQDQKVNIYNLFVEDTRESDILEQLVEKIDTIEEDLGVSSDVLGMVLDNDDFDLEDRIMDAVAKNEPGDKVVEDIDEVIKERKEAVKKIQDNFLIEDHFGESELDEVQELIRESRQDHVGQDAVRELLELFFKELDGEIQRKSSESGSDIYGIDTPAVIDLENDDVQSSYTRATFDQALAKENRGVEFISVNHPLVRGIVDYCLDGDWMDGLTTVKRTSEDAQTPGLLCNFRLGYEAADGTDETEEFVPLYIPLEGDVTDSVPETCSYVSPDTAESHEQVEKVIQQADELVEKAKREAQRTVEEMAENAEEDKRDAVEIKRKHAERYFDNAIETWQTRLEDWKKDVKRGKDMELNVKRARSKLEELKEERKQEFEQLREEESVLPKTNDLVNAAVIISE